MKPEQLREWAGAIEGEKPWAPKVADVCDQLREHAAALEEIERLKVLTADLEKEGARAIYTAVQQSERAEKAEAERDALKRHAEAMAEVLGWLNRLGGLGYDKHARIEAALDAYRAEFKGE